MQDESRSPGDVSIDMDSRASQQMQLINEQVGLEVYERRCIHWVMVWSLRQVRGLCVVYCASLQNSYIQERADTMQNIETTIVELGSIFQQLAHMVKEQEEVVQRWARVI